MFFLPGPYTRPNLSFQRKLAVQKFQGTVILKIVINRAGNIARIKLVRSLGMGLDENAMEGVERWRFSPATRHAQTVAVEMNIEVAFNLY
jgi:TonB family protein